MSPKQAPCVLIVEDDAGNRLLLQRVLEESGYKVVATDDGPSALHAASNNDFDAIVLDLGLPGMDGLSVLTSLQRTSRAPVLVLTGRSDEQSRVLGLDSGADDYMVKPYSISELSARVRALLRRTQPTAAITEIEFGGLCIDLQCHRIMIGAQLLDLTPKEFALLRFLVENSPEPFSRSDLLQHVWGSLADWQDSATVTEHVRRLRVKLATASGVTCKIETVRSVGYRVIAA